MAQEHDRNFPERPQYQAGQDPQAQAREDRDDYRRGQWRGMMRRDAGPGWRDRFRHERQSPVPQFRFTRGNSRFDIRCPRNDQFQDCRRAATQFVRQMTKMSDSSEPAPGAGDAFQREETG